MDERVKNCMDLAYKVHEGQFRKYKPVPYIVHPLEVWGLIRDWPHELEVRQRMTMECAALLHDSIEDCSEKFPKIRDLIKEAQKDLPVLQLVEELTNPSIAFKGRMNRAGRKKMDRDHLATVSWEAKMLKMWDRTCNLRNMAGADPDFVMLYTDESMALYEILKDADDYTASVLLQDIKDARKRAETAT